MENVYDDLEVIEHDPLTRRKAIYGCGANAMILFQARFNFPCDRLKLRLGSSRANDKEIGEGREVAKVQDNDVFGLLVRGKLRAGFG
jgi:hypothetical protein